MTSGAPGPVLWEVSARGVATVTLNRPEVNNAYDGALIEGLLAALDALGQAPGVRAVLIRGNGKHFQAGADLSGSAPCAARRARRTSACRARPPRRCSG